jgi:succinoglycan biosynthesis protein ExoA
VRRARILHLRASNFVGGPEHQLLRYARLEQGSDFEITLATFVGPREGLDFIRAVEDAGLRFLSLPAEGSIPSFRALVKLIRSLRFDLICAHGYKADILGIAAGRSTGIPVACFLRGWTGENRRVKMYEAVERFSLRFATRVVCLSDAQARKLSSFSALGDKIFVVRNAIDVPTFDEKIRIKSCKEVRSRFALTENCAVIAIGGRLSPEKGVEDFLEASSMIKVAFPNARFIVFGDGVLRKHLEQRALELGLQDRVIFAGFTPDLRSLLPGVDLLVNASHSEEMPNIVLEAMAAGIPVVATAVGGVEEIAGPEQALLLVPPHSPRILANSIADLLREPVRAKEIGQKGRDRVEHANSPLEQKQQFHDLYRVLLQDSHLSARSAARNRIPRRTVLPAFSFTRTEDSDPFLSVVLPVRNEASHIGTVLAGLGGQIYPHDRFEVVVADGESTDGTAKVVERFAKDASLSVRLLRNPARLSSAGRNVGARNARGQYILFMDGHCQIPSQTLLRDTVNLFEATGADCLCRPQPLTMDGRTEFQEVVAHTRATVLGHGYGSDIYGTDFEGFVDPCSSGALYRRSVFERIGYYDETFDACEDVEFNFRLLKAGLFSYLSPKLAVYYQPRNTLGLLWQQMVRYGRGRFRLIHKHPEAFSLSQIIPAGFLVWILIGSIGSTVFRPLAAAFLSTLLVYVCVVLGFSSVLGLRYGWRHLVHAPQIYLTIHFGLATGFLRELLAVNRKIDGLRTVPIDPGGRPTDPEVASELSTAESLRRSEHS